MKKHKLLKHAYDNYPKGTHFIGVICKSVFVSTGEFDFFGSDLVCETEFNGSIRVYCNDTKKWAEIVSEKKEPLLVSIDGIELFEGGVFHRAFKDPTTNIWKHNGIWQVSNKCFPITHPECFKAFSTKEAAEKWIYEANKPKEIEVKLFGCNGGFFAKVSNQDISFHHRGLGDMPTLNLKPSDIEDIAHALKQLQ